MILIRYYQALVRDRESVRSYRVPQDVTLSLNHIKTNSSVILEYSTYSILSKPSAKKLSTCVKPITIKNNRYIEAESA